jgi:hypothetical protein
MSQAALLASFAALPGFEEYAAQQRALEERALKRKMTRAMLGGCECGFVRGEDVCPQCDLGIGDAAREGAREVADLAAAMEALAPKKKGTIALTARPLNRSERRRAASRRWKR